MSITDELREYIWQHATNNDALRAIADRIDAEHERAGCIHYDPERHYCDVHDFDTDDYRRGFSEGVSSALKGSIPATDENMAEHGWVRLPKDEDGVPIRLGDSVQDTTYEHRKGVISSLEYKDGTWVAWLKDCSYGIDAHVLRHHHEPTVEDVLMEMAGRFAEADFNWGSDLDAAIADYAKRLQLRSES